MIHYILHILIVKAKTLNGWKRLEITENYM
jgi:hypothetical protein